MKVFVVQCVFLEYVFYVNRTSDRRYGNRTRGNYRPNPLIPVFDNYTRLSRIEIMNAYVKVRRVVVNNTDHGIKITV